APLAVAGRTRLRLGARLLAGAVAGRALRAGRDRDVERDAFQRVDEVDLDPGEQVVAAQPLRLVAPAARAEGAEEISEVEADLLLVERPPRLLAPLLPLLVGARLLRIEAAAQRLLAELIVRITLFGIGEDVVGDRDLLELLLGLLVARVDVRV